jgi:hypothetical protein
MALTNNKGQIRTIKFHNLFSVHNWQIKVYSVSVNSVSTDLLFAKKHMKQVETWLESLPSGKGHSEKLALVIHHFWEYEINAWLIWWDNEGETKIDFFRKTDSDYRKEFVINNNNSMIDFVQEFAIFWFERMQWHKFIYNTQPAKVEQYLNIHFSHQELLKADK